MKEKKRWEDYVNWKNLRWIFPVIFVGIMTSHAFAYLFRHQPKPISQAAPDPDTPNPRAWQKSERVTDAIQPDEQVLENEFKKLSEYLRAKGTHPPLRLSDALNDYKRTRGINENVFKQSFRFLSSNKKLDPWNHPIVYRVDRKEQKFSLHSFGPNGEDDQTEGDDIYVISDYHPKGRK